jgi:hypothetical protein
MTSEAAMLLVVSVEQQQIPFQYARSGQSPSEEGVIIRMRYYSKVTDLARAAAVCPEKRETGGKSLVLRSQFAEIAGILRHTLLLFLNWNLPMHYCPSWPL